MKTVVITGSARGFGLEMLKKFRESSYNTVICDINETALKEAEDILGKMNYNSYSDTTMKSGESVVNIQFDMETPVPQNLYNYFEG